ncbi:DHA2 family efflux MFS transporter permease subunit [Saccharopolyspora shandongensis]|uniref:DHA2 family efflux MFS transporter permease subunit n=1 Tax=Saccharopolyspora shandongensis TaxID=418495 RepID=UPI0033DC5809
MAPTTETDAGPSAARSRALLTLVVIATALVVIDMTIVTIGLANIQADLGGTLADIQWVVVAYMITMGAVTQVTGTLSDRLGRRNVYLTGIALFTLASLACGLAPNALVLDFARAVQGIGGAILMSNALPLLSHAYDGQQRNMAIATWSTMSTAASLIAPLLGGTLIDVLDWRAIFLINLPFGAVAFVIGLRTLPRDAGGGGKIGSLDWGGTALLISGLAVLNFALLRGEQQGWTASSTLIQGTVGVVLLAAFLVVQRRVRNPTLDLQLFTKPAFTGAAFTIFMSRVLTIGGTVYFVQYFQNSLHLSPTASGALLAPVFIAQMAAGMLGGKMQAWLPSGYVIAIGYACKAAGAAWMALAFSPTTQAWLLVFPLLLWGTGGGIAGAPIFAVAMNVTDKQRSGMVAGTMTSLASIGAGIGTAVLGVLYKAKLAGVVATAELPAGQHDAISAAAAEGDAQRALELAPPEAREGLQRVFEEAFAASASAVLFASASLAVITMCVALVLISKRNLPKPQQEAEPKAQEAGEPEATREG